MTSVLADAPTPQRPLRLWPGVVIVILQWLVRFGVPVVAPDAMPLAVIGGLVGGLAVVAWWVFFSRAPWSERLGAVALMIVALFATKRLLHVSIAAGAMGMLFFVLAIPVLSLAFVAWAVASSRLSNGPRRAAMVAAILLACGGWTLVRTGGFTSNLDNDFAWRWSQTPEERLLARADDLPKALPSAPPAEATPQAPVVTKAGDGPGALPARPAAPKTAPASPVPVQIGRASCRERV